MKIQITIPETAIKDVTEYCRLTKTDLQGRMQDALDAFVDNAIWFLEQQRQIEKDTNVDTQRRAIRNLQKKIKELFHAD